MKRPPLQNRYREPSDAVKLPRIDEFLQRGFVVLTLNRHDPSTEMPFEAWAYHGPLDFEVATPRVFGLGTSGIDALFGLDRLLANRGELGPVPDLVNRSAFLVDDRELATVLAALRFHQGENLQATGEIPDRAIRDVATDSGRFEALDCKEVTRLCERLNLGTEGSYLRQWRCPDCQRFANCSYDDLAEAGAPYCSDCDVEMQMI